MSRVVDQAFFYVWSVGRLVREIESIGSGTPFSPTYVEYTRSRTTLYFWYYCRGLSPGPWPTYVLDTMPSFGVEINPIIDQGWAAINWSVRPVSTLGQIQMLQSRSTTLVVSFNLLLPVL